MRNKLLLAIIALVLLVPAMSLASPASDGVDPVVVASPSYYVEGYVASSGGSGKIPMEGVIVAITDGQGQTFQSSTDSNGFFRVGIVNNVNLTISFTIFGYGISTCPNTTLQPDGTLTLELSTAQYNSATRTYTITSPVSGMQCALMSSSNGDVRGVVSFEGGRIKNATVSLTHTGGEGVYTTHTNSDGFYEIRCPVGTYVLTVSCQGFNPSEDVSVNVTGIASTVNISLEKAELQKYLGMDTAHILMLVGVIISIILAVAAWMMSKRMNGPRRLEIFEENIEEDEEIR
ncbi:MAG: carboxypeptidase-like regulatory domain-containing protein [Candidatus Methanoplasma sp.]|jgi:hypothetical protein|nr:carboxypeptidase-like regulatory domain-containing protein [Candidatus Methanoplasma sp.]